MYIKTLPRHSRTRFARDPGEGGGGGTDAGAAGGEGGSSDGGGTYTPPASQADLDRIVQDRVRRATSKFSDYDTLKEKATKHDALELELGTAADKAAAKARSEAKAEADGHWTPRVVRAEFKAAAKGVLTTEQTNALLEDLDLSKYVTDKGEIDEDKIDKKVKAFAPAGGGQAGGTTRQVTLGQGNHQQSTAKKGDAGRAMAEKKFGKQTTNA